MRSIAFRFILALLTPCITATSAPSHNAEEAYRELLDVHVFNFGGAGLSGSTILGEQCFRTILDSTNNLRLFHSALAKGSTEAKIYALAGIHKLAPDEFESAAKTVLASNRSVNTISGCFMLTVAASNVVENIRTGTINPINGFMISNRNFKNSSTSITTNK